MTTPAARSYRYWDYWGTQVTAFDLHAPHTELKIVAASVVETGDAAAPADERQLGRAALTGRPRPVRRVPGVDRRTCRRDRELAAIARDLRKGRAAGDAVPRCPSGCTTS